MGVFTEWKNDKEDFSNSNIEWQARAEKAEGELLSLKERLGVGDCDYCNEQKENRIKEIKKEEEALSEKLVKENQELGNKLAKAEAELKAIKERIEASSINQIICHFVDFDLAFPTLEEMHECSKEIEKQIGGEK